MTTTALLLLTLVGVPPLGAVLARRRDRDVVVAAAATAAALLAAAALVALGAGPAEDWQRRTAAVLAVAVAALSGGVVVRAVFRVMRGELLPRRPSTALVSATEGVTGADGEPETMLRGGAWIGYLERAGTAAALLSGFPEGVAVVLAVKGLGRYAELKQSNAPEAFIIGTLASLLWAAAAAGTATLVK